MTIAQTVAEACSGAAAFTLQGGYAVHYDQTRKLFPPAHIEQEKRNAGGRVTLSIARYDDGSRLRFTWHPARGGKLVLIGEK